jgi:hypothetical protein
MLRTMRSLLVLAPALAFAACGGGGGSKLVAITQTNAQDVASSAYGAAQFVSELANFVDGLVDVIETGSPGTFPCPGGGTTDVAITDVAPAMQISAGDVVTMDFHDCIVDVLGQTFTVNGRLQFRITSATYPSADAYDILLDATFSNLALSAFGTTIYVGGGFTLELETPDGIVFTTVASGSSLQATFQTGTVAMKNSVSSFLYSEVYDDDTGDYTITGHGRVYDGAIGGSFDSEVTAPLEGTDPDNPDTGEFNSVGSGNSSVLLFVLDNANVELRVDTNGDGIVDYTIPLTWDEL